MQVPSICKTNRLACTFCDMFLNTGVMASRVIMIVMPVTMLASGVLALHGSKEGEQ